MTAQPFTPYAELCVTSNFTFLRGASHPEELVTRAAELGLAAIAITDRNSVAGVVRAYSALKELARLRDAAATDGMQAGSFARSVSPTIPAARPCRISPGRRRRRPDPAWPCPA
jgi:error-prone DNA polymerase